MKKILAVILALFTLTLTACSAELTPEQYSEKLRSTYITYNTELMDTATQLSSYSPAEEINAAADRASAALDEIEHMNPPALYSAQHAAVCEAMANERTWLETARKIAAEGDSDELLNQLTTCASNTEFHDQMSTLIKNLRTDGYWN